VLVVVHTAQQFRRRAGLSQQTQCMLDATVAHNDDRPRRASAGLKHTVEF